MNDTPGNDQTPPTPPTQPTTPPDDEATPPSKDDRTMALLCHLLPLVSSFVGPLIVWLIKKDESTFIDDQGKEALNFQITIAIAYAVGFATSCLYIGMAILPAVGVLNIVFCVLAGVEANKGVRYRYPLCLRLIT